MALAVLLIFVLIAFITFKYPNLNKRVIFIMLQQ